MKTGKRRGRPCNFPVPWRPWIDEYGGATKLAAAMGMSYATLRNLAMGKGCVQASTDEEVTALVEKQLKLVRNGVSSGGESV